MRWYILRTLLHKEILRHIADRGGIIMALLLIGAAFLLSYYGKATSQSGDITGGLNKCYVDSFVGDDPWIDHLHQNVPSQWKDLIEFRSDRPNAHHDKVVKRNSDGIVVYRPGQAGIQIHRGEQDGKTIYQFQFWHPNDEGELTPYEAWIWKEWSHFNREQAATALAGVTESKDRSRVEAALPAVSEVHQKLEGGIDTRSAIALALVIFALFIPCVYLLPSLTCEERERGVLLAQALSPASPREILAAKFLFYPALGIGLAALLAGIYNPAVLRVGFFWLALIVTAFGTLGIGMSIACLARTQRRASMGAMCYVLAITLIMLVCKETNLVISQGTLEYHCPRMLHAVLNNTITGYPSVGPYWGNLLGAAVIACFWVNLATILFRRCGWQ
jgi:hypothetical protein